MEINELTQAFKELRSYFGRNDKTTEEHRLYSVADAALKFTQSITTMDEVETIEFGNWLGYHYYRVNGFKWRQIRDESDVTEYPIVVLYDKFKRKNK